MYIALPFPLMANIDGTSVKSSIIGLSHGSVSDSSLADSPLTEHFKLQIHKTKISGHRPPQTNYTK